jgi:Domain of unknown function (DUF4388)
MTQPSSTFRGELGLIGLFDLGQLLMLNRATGCLAVQSDDRKGYLYFEDGRLVNAVDDMFKEGEAAAYKVFAWQTGTFEFRPEAPTGNHTIDVGTDAVMLESARQQDEAAAVKGETGGPRRTERMRENRMALETLREAFERVTGEARTVGAGIDNQSPASLLFSLQLPSDRLVYRPGHPPRLRLHGEWQEIGEEPLSPPVYQELRSRLIDSRFGGATDIGRTRRILLSDGRTVALDVVNEGSDETLWLKLADFAPVQPEELGIDSRSLEDILGVTEGLVMIGGHTLEDARLVLHALVGAIATRNGGTLVLVTNDATYKTPEGPGVVLRARPQGLGAALRTVSADWVALGPGLLAGEVRIEDLEASPRVMAGVVAPDIASLLPRWLARLSRTSVETTMAYLATTSIHLVMTEHDGGDIDSLFLTVRLLDEPQRALALAGKTGALAEALERPRSGPKAKLQLHRS